MSESKESADAITDDDRDPANVMIRAGYLLGLGLRSESQGVLTDEDRVFLVRASRSLRAYAASLRGEP